MSSNSAYLDCSKKITTAVRYYRLELINVLSVTFRKPTHKKQARLCSDCLLKSLLFGFFNFNLIIKCLLPLLTQVSRLSSIGILFTAITNSAY